MAVNDTIKKIFTEEEIILFELFYNRVMRGKITQKQAIQCLKKSQLARYAQFCAISVDDDESKVQADVGEIVDDNQVEITRLQAKQEIYQTGIEIFENNQETYQSKIEREQRKIDTLGDEIEKLRAYLPQRTQLQERSNKRNIAPVASRVFIDRYQPEFKRPKFS